MKKYFLVIVLLLFVKIDVFATKYELTRIDNVLVNQFIYKVDQSVQQKGLIYRDRLVSKLSDKLDDGEYSSRLYVVVEEIKNKISEIEIIPEIEILPKESIDNIINSTYTLKNIDINKVKNTWLGWYNSVRNDLGKKAYSYDSKLEQTAYNWSKISKDRGVITHKRSPGDSYYNYNKITSWFKDKGVVCKNIYAITYSENIGYGSFSCKDGECTDELINSIRSTFNFYMGEKNKSYQPHYQSIINSYFTKIGLGIELKENGNGNYKYYLTVHYCTELLN